MKPHDKLFCAAVEDDLGSFQDAPADDGAFWIVHDRKRNAFVTPLVKVLRRIDVDTHVRGIARLACDLVFTEPQISSFVKQHASAMGVDMGYVIIGPQLAGTKTDV